MFGNQCRDSHGSVRDSFIGGGTKRAFLPLYSILSDKPQTDIAMKILKTAILVSAFALSSSGAHAALIDNGGSTTDTATGLTWLDLTYTVGQSPDSILAGFGGYVGSGWTVASMSQVCGLFGSLGDATPGCGVSTAAGPLSYVNAEALVSLLGDTSFTFSSAGWFDNSGSSSSTTGVGLGCITILSYECAGQPNSWVVVPDLDWDSGLGHYSTGTFLVRSVPLPAAAWLFGSALLGLGAIKRKRS